MLQQERGGWLQPNEEDDEDEEEEGDEVKDRAQPKWAIWLNVEASREAAHWLPWRPDKTKGQSVLFDDIGPSLIHLASPELQLRLLLSFLSFMGLPVDSALLGIPCNDPQRPLTGYDLPNTGILSVGHMTSLQGSRKWPGLGKQGEEFLTNAFHLLLPQLTASQRAALSLCWIRYEKLKGKASKRVAKRLLKEPDNRSALALWREYGHLEWLLGNVDDARKGVLDGDRRGRSQGPGRPRFLRPLPAVAQLE
ncbi:hypothetical protein CRUP_010612 [Coryphaenoides rupestris]|nr:hypothetical protein CRUP_010612 [Coryphaenoides rupestris]